MTLPDVKHSASGSALHVLRVMPLSNAGMLRDRVRLGGVRLTGSLAHLLHIPCRKLAARAHTEVSEPVAARRSALNMNHRIDILAQRGRRLRARHEYRKAANTYGELTSIEPHQARWWVLLGVSLLATRRIDDCVKALRQAMYLFRRAGQTARATSARAWLDAHVAGAVQAA